jgi:hypothetical protein
MRNASGESSLGQLMQKGCAVFFRRYEQIARRHRHAIGHAAVESLRSCVLNLGRVRHCGDYLVGCLDWVVVAGLDLREFVEHGLRELALFQIENAIVAQ